MAGPICGVVEGFYGRPWSQEQRQDLLGRLYPRWGLNSYLYSPKDDRKHRQHWQDLYSDQEIQETIAPLISCSQTTKQFTFWYGIAPGLTFRWAEGPANREEEDEDEAALFVKLEQLVNIGCQHFALLFDDIDLPSDPSAQEKVATNQSRLANRVLAHLHSLLPTAESLPTLLFCPTVYCEAFSSTRALFCPYLRQLGASLDVDIPVFWTGPLIISETITSDHIADVQRALSGASPRLSAASSSSASSLATSTSSSRLRALVLWDNLHANDYDMRRLYMGPFAGRETLRFSSSWQSPELGTIAGIFHNPNNEFPVNYIAFYSLARFAKEPQHFCPTATFQSAVQSWHHDGAFALVSASSSSSSSSMFATDSLTLDDVQLLCEFFYLPYQHGPRALSFLQNWQHFLSLVHSTSALASTTTNANHMEKKQALGKSILAMVARLVGIAERLPRMSNRELLYSLYPYVWELREECNLLQKMVEHLVHGHHPRTVPPEVSYRPFTYRSGLVADVQALLRPNRIDGGFDLVASAAEELVIRPYRREWGAEELNGFYSICLKTGNDGDDGTAFYQDLPDILGDRYTGPYLAFEPAGAFALVRSDDPRRPIGYALAVADSRAFYKRFLNDWLPDMRAKYPLLVDAPLQPNVHRSHELIAEFHRTEPLFDLDNPLFDSYPSHLHIDLIAEAQSKGFGTRMMHRLFDYLRAAGSSGVHLEMALTNDRAFRFYQKLGFVLLETLPDCLVLGLSFEAS